MTVVRAGYGLSMLMWPNQHFYLASGEKLARLANGDKVSITQFRNGDELIRDRKDGNIFFDYEIDNDLTSCAHTSIHDLPVIIPTPYHPG